MEILLLTKCMAVKIMACMFTTSKKCEVTPKLCIKHQLIEQMTKFNNEYKDNMMVLSKLTDSISEGFSLLKNALQCSVCSFITFNYVCVPSMVPMHCGHQNVL